MGEHWREWLLGSAAVALLIWVLCQALAMRPGGKAPRPAPLPVICAECGWSGRRIVDGLPARCRKCGAVAVHFAGLCPDCGRWTPWDPAREEILFARPRLFRAWGPTWFFPLCSDCGTATNATGEDSPWTRLLEHQAQQPNGGGARSERGEIQ
jgi:hypothetical protein